MPHRDDEVSDGWGSAPVVQEERIMVPAQHRWPPKLRRAHSQAERGNGLHVLMLKPSVPDSDIEVAE